MLTVNTIRAFAGGWGKKEFGARSIGGGIGWGTIGILSQFHGRSGIVFTRS